MFCKGGKGTKFTARDMGGIVVKFGVVCNIPFFSLFVEFQVYLATVFFFA